MRLRFPPGSPIVVRVSLFGPADTVEARLLLDTGAASTVIDPKLLALSGIDLESPCERVSVTTASGIVYAPRYVLPRIDGLGAVRERFTVNAHTLPPSAPIDGRLGLDFLVGLRLTLDMRRGELAVA